MNKILLGFFLILAPVAQAIEVPPSDCEKRLVSPPSEQSGVPDSLHRYAEIHRRAFWGSLDHLPGMGMGKFPAFKNPVEEKLYYEAAHAAVAREQKVIDRFERGAHPRTEFYLRTDPDPLIHRLPPTVTLQGGLQGDVLQKNQFAKLNQELGASGMWFVYRAYAWDHLGFSKLAGPHLSIVIGDRVYEVGRPLKRVGDELKLTTRGPAGPIAMSIDQFLTKSSLESAALQGQSTAFFAQRPVGNNPVERHALAAYYEMVHSALQSAAPQGQPGIFFAQRIAGVGEAELKALASYYENEAQLFQSGKKFKYAMDPAQDPDGQNCVTYLTEPLLNPTLTQALDLGQAIGLRYYPQSPVSLMDEAERPETAKRAKTFLFAEGDAWREQLDHEIRFLAQDGAGTDGKFAGVIYLELDAHPQMTGFFFRGMRFAPHRISPPPAAP